MLRAEFYSDTNLDGFVQLISLARVGHEVDDDERRVTIDSDADWVADLVSQWGGEIL